MRFYKLNGVWQSWDYLHNELGYAEHATRPTVFKSCADATWGEDAGNGYYDGDVNDMINGAFWTDADPTGWFSLDGLVWNSETYPADAAPSLLVKDGVASDALVITCDDGNYYLIRAIIDTTAWIPESEVEALGWRSPSFVVVDSTTGKVVSGCNQALEVYELPSVVLDSEDGYETYELPSVSLPVPKMVIGVPISGPVQAFWFTDEGRDETSDKTFTVVGNPLFDEDGSIARDELYELAVPLSFMQHDGNMFEADGDSDTVRYLPTTGRLTLSIPGDSTTRDKSAWSVQCAKLFVLSYANTQLPDVQIELPINEVGTYGTQITLPTIDGEYESGGKTWKPSAWDIGAFGSSYSLTADVVAHLVFEEVQQYQEITLYYSNNYKGYQTGVTSAFTGNVNANNCYQLYTDEQCTIPWTGYDYSNDYEVGWYNDGVWELLISKIEDMPSTTSGARKNGFILMDTGCMWLCTNVSSGSTYNTGTQAFIRVYPSGIQRLALYTNPSSVYNNKAIAYQSYTELYSKPGASGYIYAGNWPSKRLLKVLASNGAVVSTGYNDFNFSTYSNRLVLANVFGDSVSKNTRCVVFNISEIVYYAWTKSDKSDLIVSSNAVKKPLYDSDGNLLLGDSGYTYHCIGIFNAQGSSTGDTAAKINAFVMSVNSNSGALQYKQESGSSITVAKLWYIKTPTT